MYIAASHVQNVTMPYMEIGRINSEITVIDGGNRCLCVVRMEYINIPELQRSAVNS